MARPKNPAPVYKLHGSTGLARCWIGGKWVSLGKYGSPESRAEFARIVAEHAAGLALAPKTAGPAPAQLTVDQLFLQFLQHSEKHYRRADGQQTEELREIKRSMLFAHKLYGHVRAVEFGPIALGTVRNEMVKAGWCRTLINRRVDRLKRAYKWATSQELVPVSAYESIRTLAGLQRGRTDARESKPVKPVPVETVMAALPHMNDHVRAMVLVQLYTGMRPGEACSFSMDQVDTTGELWVYRPRQHKTAHRDKDRVVPIGPKARVVIEEFMRSHAWAENLPLFNPRVAEQERNAARTATRKRAWYPQAKVKNRKRQEARTYYTVTVLGRNIARACEAAGVPRFAPNQLRHTFATEVRRRFGLDAAGVLLGHSRLDVTQIYAEKDLARAIQVAREVG